MRVTRAEEHAIRHDHGRAATHFEETQKQMKKKNFGFLALRRQSWIYVRRINRTFERGIGKHEVVAFFLVE
jgi:hypothetical protein